MSEKLLELHDGLELWRVDVDELREQDKNARVVAPDAFDRLTTTVKRDRRLESLPFCALTDRGIEVVSGHHRVRAARAGELPQTYALVDTTGLSRSQIAAKQLAHNSIQGEDDPQVVREIYEAIEEADARLEAFIDPAALDLELERLSVGNLSVDFDYRSISVSFLPHEQERFARAAEALARQLDPQTREVYEADLEWATKFRRLTRSIGAAYEVKAFGTILGIAADIVLEQIGEDTEDEQTERVHLSQVVRQAYVPREAADIIRRAVDRMEAEGHVGPANRWQALEFMAANYLAEAEQPA